MNEDFIIEFWGVRGTLPVPGPNSLRYGGNTNCVTSTINGKHLFIFDAGTGIKKLSENLIRKNTNPIKAKIFITHPHVDHINTLPYFTPFYQKGNEFEIFCGCGENSNVEELIFKQMDRVYFPVTVNEFQATLTYKNVREESFYIDDINIQTKRLNHPGICFGYRVQRNNKSFCYITDNELYLPNSPQYDQDNVEKFIKFIHNTDVLIIDTTYFDEDYALKVNWGHSCVSQVVDVAHKAKVKKLCLFHHDPSQMDNDIDNKVSQAQKLLKERESSTQCIAPCEGDKLIL